MADLGLEATGERGQAQLEMVAGLPFLLIAVAIALQLFGLLHAQSAVDGAAEAGALAVASGHDPRRAVRAALGDWPRKRFGIEVDRGRVRVDAKPPVVLPLLAGRLSVSATAYARAAD